MKPHKIWAHSAHTDNFYFDFFYGFSEWAEILWGFTKLEIKKMLNISAVYLEKQKSFIPKKNSKPRVNRFQYQNNQLCLLTQFSEMVLSQATATKQAAVQTFFMPPRFIRAWSIVGPFINAFVSMMLCKDSKDKVGFRSGWYLS